MSTTVRGNRPRTWSSTWMSVLFVLGLWAGIVASAWVGEWLTPTGTNWGLNPLSILLLWATGVRIPPASIALLLVLVVVLVWLLVARLRGPGGRSRNKRMADRAKLMATKEDIAAVSVQTRAVEAARLHPNCPGITPGLHVGRWVLGGDWLYQGQRQCGLFVMGPGRGKSTALLVRGARWAPGSYTMAGNKVDGVKEVLAARAIWHPGGQVWMLDMQQVFRKSGKPAFWFNPLLGITNSEQATNLASVLEEATKGVGDRGGDAQFDEQGRSFLAACILAQALIGGTMDQAHAWVSSADFLSPREVLIKASSKNRSRGEKEKDEQDFSRLADQLFGMSRQPEDTMGSVAASAQRMASSLTHDHLLGWIRPNQGLPQFDPVKFLSSHDTLIALSKGSSRVVTGLMTAFLEAIFETGERLAQANGGRLPVPAVFDLDEFGNTVALPKMGDWFTYFGSMGMMVRVFIQSEAFGEQVMGEAAWRVLKNAAGIFVFGGGIREKAYLADLSALYGKTDEYTASYTSNERGPASRSISSRQEDILTIKDLHTLPMWHAVMEESSGVVTIVRLVPWFEDPEMAGPIQAVLDAGKRVAA
jgi:type IV secretory pathway TraG/TraD family ATPase VirD4